MRIMSENQNKFSKIDVGKDMCRICLVQDEGLESLFNTNQSDKISKLGMLRICMSSQIILKDKYPKSICKQCTVKLRDAYNFICLYRSSINKIDSIYNYLISTEVVVLLNNTNYEKECIGEDSNNVDTAILLKDNLKDDLSPHKKSIISNHESFICQNSHPNEMKNSTAIKINNHNSEQNCAIELNNFSNLNATQNLENFDDQNQIDYIKDEKDQLEKEFFEKNSKEPLQENCAEVVQNVDKNQNNEISQRSIYNNNIAEITNKNIFFVNNSPRQTNICAPPKLILESININKVPCSNVNEIKVIENISKQSNRICLICNKKFNTAAELSLHDLKSHKFKTSLCSKVQNESNNNISSSLNNHLEKLCHNCGFHPINLDDEIGFKCDACQKQYKCIDSEKYICEYCGKKFLTWHRMNGHVKQNHKAAFECEFCPKKFSSLSKLKIHRRMHTGEKPYLCNICSRSFATNSTLTIHQSTHTRQINFQCSICKKLFSRRNNLKTHLMTHSGLRRFICKICDKAFTQNHSLKYHMRIHEIDAELSQKKAKQETLDNNFSKTL